MTQVVITGANGFVGRNLAVRLLEQGIDTIPITRATDVAGWRAALEGADAVIHLAGSNRPENPADFMGINVGTTEQLSSILIELGRAIPIIYSSSSKAGEHTEYGRSKQLAEARLGETAKTLGAEVYIYRLPNVFGKWARPNYNSAVATFCHNIARDLPIEVHDRAAPLTLVYVDDVINEFIEVLTDRPPSGIREVAPVYTTTVGELADTICGFREDRGENLIANVGTGFVRALYATYVSALPKEKFSYPIARHGDPRGSFSEMLKTRQSGQFSYFTAHPGVTRGGHYHHTKTEKFLIVHGRALFRFRHIVTGETYEIQVSGDCPEIVETIPGWAHDVTNIGDTVLISLLWANEIFDRSKPDTISAKV